MIVAIMGGDAKGLANRKAGPFAKGLLRPAIRDQWGAVKALYGSCRDEAPHELKARYLPRRDVPGRRGERLGVP